MEINKKLVLLFFVLPISLFSQNASDSNRLNTSEQLKIQPVLALQLWTTYSYGTRVYNKEKGIYEAAENRFNTQLRRSRIGLKGQFYEHLKYNLTASLDLVGKDVLTGTEAGGNNGASPQFRLWNAYIQWQLIPEKESVNLVAGYFTPQMGRESITGAMRSTTMEKSWSQNYLRKHLTGTGPGRAAGINLGGLLKGSTGSIGFRYDIGLFNPVFQSLDGNSSGIKNAPLLVGRLVTYLGQPEADEYSLSHKVNYFGKRKGLAFAVSGAYQGNTDLFTKNYAAGIDFLFNWNKLNMDGEWTYLWRGGAQESEGFNVLSKSGYLRLSYNNKLDKGFILEPVLMYVFFEGETDYEGQFNAILVRSFSGRDANLNLGLNFYFNPNLKLSLNYTLRKAAPGALGDGAPVNNYFFQSGVGAIRRGNWLGLGLVAVL